MRVAVLGSTGSIGASTLDVLGRHPDRFEVAALAAATSHRRLFEQCCAHRPGWPCCRTLRRRRSSAWRCARLACRPRWPAALMRSWTSPAVPDVDAVMAAIVGAAGLPSTLAAARAGKRVLLANKESLVVGGALLLDAAREGGATLIPIDSEHNAIFQCLPHGFDDRASGTRRAPRDPHGIRWAVPAHSTRRTSRALRPSRPAPTLAGAWGARSRSIRRR